MPEKPDIVKIHEALEIAKQDGNSVLYLGGLTIELAIKLPEADAQPPPK